MAGGEAPAGGGGRAGAQAPSTSDWWRPSRPLANVASVLLGLQALVLLVAPLGRDQAHQFAEWHRAWDALLDGREREAERIYRHANEGFNAWSLISLAVGAVLVVLIMWMWRSAHNARALGRTGARLSPGWAIGAWFIPVANFVLLYLLYSDLWRSSAPDSERGDAWRAFPGSVLVRLFWVLYVVGGSLSVTAIALAVSGTTDESATRVLLVTASALNAAAALLNILVIREITARQEALQARDPAPTERPEIGVLVAPTTADGPGWRPDPGGQFDHRYWDGTAWTEHVSRGGVATTALLTPADWYPDPTGRFEWRYWTGHEWTEHASRDQQLFVDPLDVGGAGAPGASAPDPS